MLNKYRNFLSRSVRRLDRSVRIGLNARRGFPELSVAALEAQPIFVDLPQEHARHLHKSRKDGSLQKSQIPAEINWAPNFDEARKIALAEDKPIFVVTYCPQNNIAARDP